MSDAKWTPQGELRRPEWLDAWQDYPHGPLDEARARELNGYSVRLEDRIRELYGALKRLRIAVIRKGCNDPEASEEESARLFNEVLTACDGAATALAKAEGSESSGGTA